MDRCRSNKEASGAYDQLGELDQALFMYLDHGHGGHASSQQHEQRRKCPGNLQNSWSK
jgi:transcription factor TGA